MSLHPLSDEETSDIRLQLNELRVEHRDLDLVITHLIENPPPDELLVRRLKKRKLVLKDRILILEQMLVPDIPA
ncbi:YdcH family protein [Azonexus sp.]|uniref:YdcH family protein n=1 Tax=Azonexus sp. TaxID=1872668 RepID=UPI0035B0A391